MKTIIIGIFFFLLIIDCLSGIFTTIIFFITSRRKYFKEDEDTEKAEEIKRTEPWVSDNFFMKETLPLGLIVEEALSQRKHCDELIQLTNRVLSDEKSFVWLWDYANKYELKNLQKELVRISKLNGETPIYAVS